MPSSKHCPSALCETGNLLLGVVDSDGNVKRITPMLEVDEDFVSTAQEHGDPYKRFRFVGRCRENECVHWQGEACKIAADLTQALQTDSDNSAMNNRNSCAIRGTCRWFSQEGWEACNGCARIITAGK